MVKIIFAQGNEDEERWQRFLEGQTGASNYHRWGWKQVIEASFGWPTYYLMAEEQGRIVGILPLVWQKSWLFGSFLTSLPFLNAGGVVTKSRLAEDAMIAEAIALAERLGAHHLELRHRRDHRLNLPVKTNKVSVVRPVTPDSDALWSSLSSNVRRKVRKAEQYGLVVEFGGEPHLSEFYHVFAENMRNLGTPVYGRNFFRQILRIFPDDSYLCIVRQKGKAIAASFLTGFRDSVEAMWICSLYSHTQMKPNMYMYWKMMEFAGRQGYKTLDLGRSSVGSGTHRFKMQWGSQEVPLYWVYWLPEGKKLPELNPENPRFRLAVQLWKHVPLFAANRLGPRIVRCLP